jgi:hypothetical protein
MIKFPLTELLDEQACYEWLSEILHHSRKGVAERAEM